MHRKIISVMLAFVLATVFPAAAGVSAEDIRTSALSVNSTSVDSEYGIKNYPVWNKTKIPYIRKGNTVITDISGRHLERITGNTISKGDGGKIIRLDYNSVNDAKSISKLELSLNTSLLEYGEYIVFIVGTPFGIFIFTSAQLNEWSDGNNGEYTVTMEKTIRGEIRVGIKKDGRSVKGESAGSVAKIGIEYRLKDGEKAGNAVITDKDGRIMPESVYENGFVFADIPSAGTYKTAYAEEPFIRTEGTNHAEGWGSSGTDGNEQVYYTKNGFAITGWQKTEDGQGNLKLTGWLARTNGDIYCFNNKGKMVIGKNIRIDGMLYSFGEDGALEKE